MSPISEALLNTALTLPPEEREEIAERLMRSLDGTDYVALSPEWKEEIERRMQEVRDGTTELIDGEVVLEWLRSKGDEKARP